MRFLPPPPCVAAALALCFAARAARADDPPPRRAAAADREIFPFRPYSFVVGALSTSALVRADALCPPSSSVCPFGGGGGVFVAGGRRYARQREWLAGYDLSVRNARNLFSSATLQQLRVEHRWVISSPFNNVEGFIGVGGGIAVYGELLGVRTVGPVLSASVGGGLNLSAFVNLGFVVRFDAMRFLVPFVAGDGVLRADGGLATTTTSFLLAATFLGL